MGTTTEHSTELFNTEGYSIIPSFLNQEQIDTLRRAINRCTDRISNAFLAPHVNFHPEAPVEERLELIFKQDQSLATALMEAVLVDAHHEKEVQDIFNESQLPEVVKEYIAPHTLGDFTCRFRIDAPSFSKLKHRWHSDLVFPNQRTTTCYLLKLACWLPLQDVNANSGALEIHPGTSREVLTHIRGENGKHFIPDSELPESAPQSVDIKAGDLLLLDRFLPHRTTTVIGNQIRWSLVTWCKSR